METTPFVNIRLGIRHTFSSSNHFGLRPKNQKSRWLHPILMVVSCGEAIWKLINLMLHFYARCNLICILFNYSCVQYHFFFFFKKMMAWWFEPMTCSLPKPLTINPLSIVSFLNFSFPEVPTDFLFGWTGANLHPEYLLCANFTLT